MKVNLRKRKDNEPKSLNKRLLVFMILCWVVPIVVFFTFTMISYRDGIITKAENLMEKEMENASSVIAIRIDEAISLCQKPSYEKVWENNWENYKRSSLGKSDFLQNINGSLRGKFHLDERFNMYAFYLVGSENPDCYSSRVGRSYTDYVENAQDNIREILDGDSSYVRVKVYDGRIYIIRNLYTTSRFEWYGTLVVELNWNKIFQGISRDLRESMAICISDREDRIVFYDEEKLSNEQKELFRSLGEKYDGRRDGVFQKMGSFWYNAYLYEKKCDNYHIGMIVTSAKQELYSSLYSVYEVVIIMMLLFLPLICYGVLFLRKQIQSPIRKLVDASKKMADGEIGYVITDASMPNQEFAYLMEYFNHMSIQVKNLIDSVYTEKLARKDAQIQALQAQINPHFLNNTLEMMNWQARMSGDTVVSKMIESLGTVLDYRMNRANVKEIWLSEELRCTDAYFYIMSMRFGQRLQIEREIDDDILRTKVPPLILQPIVENAIVHGVEAVKNGRIELKVFHDEEKVYLRVINSGKPLSEEDKSRIDAMLAGDDSKIPVRQGYHTSIGIRNVNQRIKLVYGEEYGLEIKRGEDDRTVSTITIPYVLETGLL